MDPFGSHVVRALLLLLSAALDSSHTPASKTHSNVRSRKSTAWKARQGPMKSVFEQDGKSSVPRNVLVPPEFEHMSRKFVLVLRDGLDENEVRALAANKVASPVLQVIFSTVVVSGWLLMSFVL
jgi:nucleolar protein 9